MKLQYTLATILTASLFPFAAQTLPTQTSCSTQVKNPVGLAANTYMDEDCQTLYVSPPHYGRAEVTDLQFAPNLDRQCSGLRALHKKSLQLSKKYGEAVKSGQVEEAKIYESQWRNIQGEIAASSNQVTLKAKVVFYADHDYAVARFQRVNPHLRVRPLPLTRQQIVATERSADDFKPEEQSAVYTVKLSQSEFVDGVYADVELTNAGACPLREEQNYDAIKV